MQPINLQVVPNNTSAPNADSVAPVVKPKRVRKPRVASTSKVATPNATSVNQSVVQAPVAPVRPAPPKLSKAEMFSNGISETAIFSKNVAVGFSKTFINSALTLLAPVLFLFKNILIISKGAAHLGAPLAMAWFAMYSIEGVAAMLVNEPGYMKLGYFVCFAAATSFVWVSFCLWLKSISDSAKATLSRWAEVGKNTA